MSELLGRWPERQAVAHLLAESRAGRSGALVVRGEAGIGKSALLDHVRDAAVASGFRAESAAGVEAEARFAFAGLHQLCVLLLDGAGSLPGPQRAALEVAFGRQSGPAPDRFLVGLAVLTLLAEASEQQPLLCLVDDAQWLDPASAEVLAFVARRSAAERLALVFGVRGDEDGAPAFTGLPELRLDGLGETDARTLLTTALRAPLDDAVRDRIIAEARGNPLALLEMPAHLRPGRVVAGFELSDGADVPSRVEHEFRLRSNDLPASAQLLLLVAAAEPTGDVALLWRAAAHLDLTPAAAAPAETAGLLEIDTRVRFRHPLVRSAVYQAAAPPDRRRAHGALADATDPVVDPDRRAAHRAQAVMGADEEVAAELERSADRAGGRGGFAASAAFLQQAVELTPDRAARARRALGAAQASYRAGAAETTLELLDIAAAGPLDALQRARTDLLRAQALFHLTRGVQVPGMLLAAATALAPLDEELAREASFHALDAAIINGGTTALSVAEAVLAAPRSQPPARPVDLLLEGLAVSLTRGFSAGVPLLRPALEALRERARAATVIGDRSQPWLWMAGRVAVGILDDDLAHDLAADHVRLARAAGALGRLPAALNFQANLMVVSGQLARAAELAAEATAITGSTGGVPLHHAQALIAGWRGDRAATTALNVRTSQESTYPAEGTEAALAQYAKAVLHNGFGEYAEARAPAARACDSVELSPSSVGLAELVEASVRSGDHERTADALERLSARAHASGTSWALGIEARSRALAASGPAAEELYREAVARLDASQIAGEAARAHLVYGEWLRREGRRQDARDVLRTAYERLSEMGADAFAARAARELRAAGEHPRQRTARPTDGLTDQELHIARLVATGATSREVATQLFLSPRTIEAHLRNIFRKLDITSRRQLRAFSLP